MLKPFVILNPGHFYPPDPGVVANGFWESNLTVELVNLIAQGLPEYGIDYVIIHSNDLDEICRLANRCGSNVLFVSYHFNSGGGNGGYEDYCYDAKSPANTYRSLLRIEVMNYLRKHEMIDRGAKHKKYDVLSGTIMPAILCENLFLDNLKDASLLSKPGFMQGLADAHIRGLARALGQSKKTKEENPIMSDIFKDVRTDDYALNSIERVSRVGLMVGDTEGTFRPDSPITRREMAIILARQLAYDGSFKEILPSAMPAVVSLVFESALGSGFFVSPDGYIITNKHVASISTTGRMTLIKDGRPNAPVRVVALDQDHDLALLKMDGVTNEPYLKLAASPVERGDHVGVIGSPKGYGDTFTQGVVSHISRPSDPVSGVVDRFQTDAAINPGNSGGPIINENGEVVGVAVAKYVDAAVEGLCFGIHVKYARELLKKNGVGV